MTKEMERQFRCTTEGCGEVVTTELPAGEFINKPTVSMLVMVHQEAVICQKCGQAYCFVLRGIKGMEMGWMPVVVQKADSDIILPPTSLTNLLNRKGD